MMNKRIVYGLVILSLLRAFSLDAAAQPEKASTKATSLTKTAAPVTPSALSPEPTPSPTPLLPEQERKEEKELKAKASFSGVTQLSDDLYMGKVADKFYLAMEKITPENLEMWRQYAYMQDIGARQVNNKYLPNSEGASHFKMVLDYYESNYIDQKLNELWVAYASRTPIETYTYLNIGEGDENPNIEMYVTVITSPDALITSHMGISRTWEAAIDLSAESPDRIKHTNQSIHLHSFAAKVMKMIDPKKVYMLTAPAIAMRDILIKKMPPQSVFIGDNLYKYRLEEAAKDPLSLLSPDSIEREEAKGGSPEEQEKRVKAFAERMYKRYQVAEILPLLKTTNPPRIIKKIDPETVTFTIQKPNGTPLVSFDNSTTIYQWVFTTPYLDRGLLLPYVLVELNALVNATALIPESVSLSALPPEIPES